MTDKLEEKPVVLIIMVALASISVGGFMGSEQTNPSGVQIEPIYYNPPAPSPSDYSSLEEFPGWFAMSELNYTTLPPPAGSFAPMPITVILPENPDSGNITEPFSCPL